MDESDYGAQIILDADLMDDTIDLGPGSVSNLSCYPASGEFTSHRRMYAESDHQTVTGSLSSATYVDAEDSLLE